MSALVTYPSLPGHLAMPHSLLMTQVSPPCSLAVTASLHGLQVTLTSHPRLLAVTASPPCLLAVTALLHDLLVTLMSPPCSLAVTASLPGLLMSRTFSPSQQMPSSGS